MHAALNPYSWTQYIHILCCRLGAKQATVRLVGGAYPLINPDAADLGGAHVRIKVHQVSTLITLSGLVQHHCASVLAARQCIAAEYFLRRMHMITQGIEAVV